MMEGISSASLDPSQLEALVNNDAVSTQQKLKEVSVQFESIMLREYLNTSLKPLLKSQMGEGASGSHVYEGMIIDHMADTLARSGQFGVADAFYQEMKAIVPDKEIDPKSMSEAPEQSAEDLDEAGGEAEETASDERTSPEDAAQIQSLYQLWAQKGML